MSQVIYGMLISNGRITMLEISRWTETGGSYRTIQRLYHTLLLWLQIQWVFFVSQLQKPNHEYIAAGDEVVVGKAGKETYGIGRETTGGRPKSSKNKKSEKPTLHPELLRRQAVSLVILVVLKGVLAVQYLVMDGHFGKITSAKA